MRLPWNGVLCACKTGIISGNIRIMQLFKTKEGATPSSPTLFCAPMAGVTHSAFRRLLADFGGYGAIYTELLAGRQMVNEEAGKSPYLKRRAEEG